MKHEAGRLDSRVSVHSLSLAAKKYTWAGDGDIWAHAEQGAKPAYLSKIGVGAPAAEFIFRAEPAPTMQNALGWQGRTYYPTAIEAADRAAFVKVAAAQVEVMTATLTPYGREAAFDTFPAVLIEKYLRYAQERPMAVAQERYVLIVPKTIALEVADLVTLPGLGTFHVDVPHRLDPARNEYEIAREVDV